MTLEVQARGPVSPLQIENPAVLCGLLFAHGLLQPIPALTKSITYVLMMA